MLARSTGFELATIWHLAVLSVWVQLGLALRRRRREFSLRLRFQESGLAGVHAR